MADTVEWILPSLLRIFTSTDKACEFQPERPADEQAAKQATDAVNYVFYRQNPGFETLYAFFKDALTVKNAYIKVWPEKGEKKRKDTYRGLTEPQLLMLTNQPGAQIIAASSYPDPTFSGTQAPMQEGAAPQPAPNLYDVVIERTEEYNKVCIAALPPEEVLVSKRLSSVDPADADFIAHRCEKTVSELREMGYPEDVLSRIPSSDDGWLADSSPEKQARDEFDEDETRPEKVDPAMRTVWVTEAYIRVDFDGDGIAELRRVVKAGHEILENEEADVIPIAAITPTIMTHRHFGKSVADWVMDIQRIKSTILRNVLDNIYLTTTPRMIVLADPTTGAPRADVGDLVSRRIGGIVREYAPGAVREEKVTFMGQHGLQVMEYMDTIRENRTGVTRYNQGVDANTLNKTATGISQIMSASQQRIELIARVFAETGVKRIFQLILHCLVKYGGQRPITLRLRDEWVDYDPSNWSSEMDMTVNVGLGTGNKDQQLVHLQSIAMAQAEAVKMGGMGLLVTPKNLYNAQAKIVENAGFKSVEDFWTDPGDRMPEPQPDPQAEAEKQKADLDRQAKEHDMMLKSRAADQEYAHKERMAALDFEIEQQRMALKREEMQMGLMADQQRISLDLQSRQEAAQLDRDSVRQKMAMTPEGEVQKLVEAFAQGLAQVQETVSRLQKIQTATRQLLTDEAGEPIGVKLVTDDGEEIEQRIG